MRPLDEALEVYAAILDGIDSRAFKDGLIKATGLSEADLEWRIKQARDQARARQGQAILQRTARTLQEKAAEADLLAGEEELVQSLLQIRQARGVAAPGALPPGRLPAGDPPDLRGPRYWLPEPGQPLQDTDWSPHDSGRQAQPWEDYLPPQSPGEYAPALSTSPLLLLLLLGEARSRLALKLTMIMAGEMINPAVQSGGLSLLPQEQARGDNGAIERALERFGIYARSAQLFLVDAMPPAEDLAAMISQAMGRLDPGPQRSGPGGTISRRCLSRGPQSSNTLEVS